MYKWKDRTNLLRVDSHFLSFQSETKDTSEIYLLSFGRPIIPFPFFFSVFLGHSHKQIRVLYIDQLYVCGREENLVVQL